MGHINKHNLLGILASEVCPICGGMKQPHTWACGRCYGPHLQTPEHYALSDRCDEHIAAAHAFVEMARAAYDAKRPPQKPETD